MLWNLYYFDENDNPQLIGKYKSVDSAKQHARRFQIGFGRILRFEIKDPQGNLWLYGKAQMIYPGFRMKWWYPKFSLTR